MGRVIIILIILIIWLYLTDKPVLKKHCSVLDDRCYHIVKNFNADTFDNATELLAYLNQFNLIMIKHMRNKYLWQDSNDLYRIKMARHLLNNYDPDSMIENNPPTSENTSYVQDKGRVFAVCLREKLSGQHKFHTKQELEFVVLHEMAHLTNEVYDHNDEFWKDFKILLIEAKEINIHNPVNYEHTPFNYCSVHVDYSPYFDKSIKV